MRMKNSNNAFARLRLGFTLVELLVVIAIIGILVGLLLPAVQAAREAARRCACMNNMSQIALAIHNHEFGAERFPAGVINPNGPIRNEAIGIHVSWIVNILPYMEQNAVYSHFDQAAGTYAPANRDARSQRIPTLVCPSHYYPGSYGQANSETDGTQIAISNYAGCHHDIEAPIDANNNGLLFLNSHLRFGDIRDGSSNTIMVGEMIPGVGSLGWASGTRATLRNTGSPLQSPNFNSPQANTAVLPTGSLDVGGFGSFHTGGAQFALGDGSVRFLSQNISVDLYRKLGNRADGEMFNEEF